MDSSVLAPQHPAGHRDREVETLADSGWIVVAGAVVGGSLTGTVAFLQARWQHKFDAAKSQEDRRWTEQVTARERDHAEMTRRRDELLEIYTRYQLAADRLENAVRELADVRPSAYPDAATAQAGEPVPGGSDPQVNHLREERLAELYEIKRDAYETAQNEYDKACQIVNLIAPLQTVEVILRQRQPALSRWKQSRW
jgi:hypothetical protein